MRVNPGGLNKNPMRFILGIPLLVACAVLFILNCLHHQPAYAILNILSFTVVYRAMFRVN